MFAAVVSLTTSLLSTSAWLPPNSPSFPFPSFPRSHHISLSHHSITCQLAAICTSSPSKSVSLSISCCLFTSSASFSPLSVPHSQSHEKFKQIKLHQYGTPRLLGIGTHQLHPPPYLLLLEWLSEYITTQWVAPTHSNASHNVSDSQFPNWEWYMMNIFAQSLNSLHQIHPDTPNPLEQSWYFCNLLSWTIHHLQKSPYGQKSVFFSKAWFSVLVLLQPPELNHPTSTKICYFLARLGFQW